MRPEETRTVAGNECRELQDKFCRMHHIYSIYVEDNLLQKDLMQVREWQGMEAYVTPELCRDLLGQLRESDVEEVVEAELPVDYIKVCAVAVRVKQKVVAKWLVGGILKEKLPEEAVLPEEARCTTEEEFYEALQFMCSMFRSYFQLGIGNLEASEESKKSRQAESQMKQELKRSECMTSIVQMLESEQEFSEVAEKIFEYAGAYLGIEAAQLIQLNTADNSASVVCEWTDGTVEGKKEKHQGRPVTEYPFINGKPYMLSGSTPLHQGFRTYFQEEGLKAGIFLPIEVNGRLAMYLSFLSYTVAREWEITEIKFVHDVRRIIQSILIKRVTKNSLAGSYASLEEILDNIGCGICVLSLAGDRILFMNQKFRTFFRGNMEEKNIEQLLNGAVEKSGIEELYVAAAKKWFDVHRTEIVWVNGKNVALYTVYDITENKKYQQRIEKQLNNDFLTGLYNRMRCEADLERYIEQTKEEEGEGALLYMDLDDFKHINDGLGHQYGDVLLRAISHSLQRISGIESSCYRMGGDEFIIVVTHAKYWMLGKIVDEILEIFSKPWFLKGADYYCTASMGIVRFPSDGDNVQELIKKADMALLEAKKSGKNRVAFYGEGVESGSFKRLDLEKNMRNATMNACNEFEVYYQPIVKVTEEGNPCTGAEALIRWNCENLGFISPAEFIPLAEYLGLINPIGDYVLKEACRSCKYWNDMGHPEYKVNVNLSVVQLLRNDVAERIQEIIQETRVNPKNLTLEVTESLAINDMARMKQVLGKIKELGVRVALDDFGTGYSSLNHIREMPIDVIKIDKCFIDDLGKEPFDEAFVRIVCELASTIGMHVCVEGVESEQQYEILKKMQIQMIQGFYFAKPMTKSAFEEKYL